MLLCVCLAAFDKGLRVTTAIFRVFNLVLFRPLITGFVAGAILSAHIAVERFRGAVGMGGLLLSCGFPYVVGNPCRAGQPLRFYRNCLSVGASVASGN